ncbi:hypothetical protein CORT_0A00490 [Candida orthopsilosis Co 90-125]|uniref:Uncharacterized protein n=1 Tax=Candida orthopsilosis (strain 90-125) TaxID=1136231 RepID=H8WVH0_CANO9|nr:hypothetical protein CORT_0A00490 [Candida orthopsilosis Co 90-125]CCG20442.1 hypothetical protein CORT_0A00490 [Candida orthopsilosis Co 90-125]
MSDINQVKQKVKQSLPKGTKKFDSKSLQHVNNYSLVKQLEQLILSISLFKTIHQQFVLPIYQFLITNVLSISPIYEIADLVDGFNLYFLGVFDHLFIDLPNKVINFVVVNFIKPINQQIIHVNNTFLKPVENEAEDSIFQIYYTIKSIVYNATSTAFSKSNEIQHQILSTYNQELSSTPANKSYLEKNLTASYNTGVKTVKTLNDDFIVPLKNQTQEFVTNGKKNAESFLKETRDKIEPKLNNAAAELNDKKDDLLKNNSVPVPAN